MDKIISGVYFFSIRSTSEQFGITEKQLKNLLIENNIFYKKDRTIIPYVKYLEEGKIYEYTTKKGFKKFLINGFFISQNLNKIINKNPDTASWKKSLFFIMSHKEKLKISFENFKPKKTLLNIEDDKSISSILKSIHNNLKLFSEKEQIELNYHFIVLSKKKEEIPFNLNFL